MRGSANPEHLTHRGLTVSHLGQARIANRPRRCTHRHTARYPWFGETGDASVASRE
jgi:hypothetical protein